MERLLVIGIDRGGTPFWDSFNEGVISVLR